LRLTVPADLHSDLAGKRFLHQQMIRLRPGRYRLDLVVKDVVAGKTGVSSQAITVPEFSNTDSLTASTLILADVMEPVASADIGKGSFVLGATRVRPRVPLMNGDAPVFTSGEKVNVWLQAYNLNVDEKTGRASADIEYRLTDVANRSPVLVLNEEMNTATRQITFQKNLSKVKLMPGVYRLNVNVKDRVSGQTVERDAIFAVR
jgi:hypothetical protein